MRVLLVRPWIHDFSAYDLWIQPLGLLYLAGVLEQSGFDLDYIDCLQNRYEVKPDGRAKFVKQIIPTPPPIRNTERFYGRFGISPEQFRKRLETLEKPDAILVTSGMTYWYPGVQETIRYLKEVYRDTVVLLGGVYATLMPEHARKQSGADVVASGECESRIVSLLTSGRQSKTFADVNQFPYPAWQLTGENRYRILYTSRGCPYRCTFCASDILNAQKFQQRCTNSVLEEVKKYYYEDHIRHFVFYDDALLIHHRKHLQPLLRAMLENSLNAKFHTPNGLNAREISDELAELMHASGFQTIRLSLESTNPEIQKRQGNNKINNHLFERAVQNLYRAGYGPGDLECYLIQGLPGQTLEDVRNSLRFVADLGVIARLATFSPIPGTPEAAVAREQIGDEFLLEPLLQNHSVFPLRSTSVTPEDLQEIKHECNAANDRNRKTGTAGARLDPITA